MTSVKLLLNKTQPLKNGTYPLVFQIIHQRKKKLIYTPFKAYQHEFDGSGQKILYVSDSLRLLRETRRINRSIGKQRKNIQFHIEKLDKCQKDYTVADILFHYKVEHNPLSLLHYMDLQIQLKKEIGKDGTVAAYRSTRASLASFINQREIVISQVDCSFVRDYEQFLSHRGVCDNTICYYMRNLRAMYQQAILEGHHPAEANPFQYLRAKPRKTVKRAISREVIRHMADLDLSHKKNLEVTRDIFLFSFFARGMSFVDVVFLKKPKNTIDYNRKKSQQWLSITITPQLAALIDKYQNNSEYVFPILKTHSQKPLYEQYRLALSRINRNLKTIGKMLGGETTLTTYVARHSWATGAKDTGAPIAVISESMGHTSEKMTRIYLRGFDQSVLDKTNEKVSEL